MPFKLEVILLLLIFFSLLLILWESYTRFSYFSRIPENLPDYLPNILYSPAEGTVVYINRNISGDDIVVNKLGRATHHLHRFDCRCCQVGIFMTTFDNHHVVNPVKEKLFSREEIHSDFNESMVTIVDTILSLFGVSFYKWSDRCTRFLSINQQWILSYPKLVDVIITMDRFVNKMDWYWYDKNSPDQRILGFIHRGSQTDIIIPEQEVEELLVKKGDHVTFNTMILRRKI